MSTPFQFDWSELAFSSKKSLNDLNAIFIAAPRELSAKRFTQLVKTYLPTGDIVLGLAKEPYVAGLEEQPQFKMLQAAAVQSIVDKVNTNVAMSHKIYILHYFQRETVPLLEKLKFREVLLINGSWYHSFHTLPAYYTLINTQTPHSLLSPFASEAEARDYEARYKAEVERHYPIPNAKTFNESAMMQVAAEVAKFSFDYTFQTGAALGKKFAHGYQLLARSFNKVVPYQTRAMHYGSIREQQFSPPGDLNFYDTVHAEVELIIAAGRQGLSLTGTTLFITLLPCPTCARMLAETDIAEVVYQLDHSDGYAVTMLESAGKIVRRVAGV